MKVNLVAGQLIFGVNELLENLTDDEKIELVDTLSCHDAVIKNVADQIISGWTELLSHGGKGCSPEKPYTPLDLAIREIAKSSSDIAKDEIGSLERATERAVREKEQYSRWAFAMYHAWGHGGARPSLNNFIQEGE